MKRFIYSLLSLMIFAGVFVACNDEEVEFGNIYEVKVQLKYPADEAIVPQEGIKVQLKNSSGIIFDATTDANGIATFKVTNGIYESNAYEQRFTNNLLYKLNGITNNIIVNDQWNNSEVVNIEMISSKANPLIITELYVGGILDDKGEKNYHFDKYVKLYNNTSAKIAVKNLCLAILNPYNGHAVNRDLIEGKLVYADKGFIPAGNAIWYFSKDVEIGPYQEIVIALNGAINHTITYKNSVDLSNSDYCTYDPEDFGHTSYYPTPSEKIPSANYLKAYKFGQGTGWPISNNSPAFYIFSTQGITPEEFASNQDYHYVGNIISPVWCCAKVPTEWIMDAIEVFNEEQLSKSNKRLTPEIDGGYTLLTNSMGHTSYRNVDKEATEALEENKGKIVYGYRYGTENSTDPSGIDAVASMKNGAKIVYMDTNNSSKDFHQRKQSTLKD